MSPFDEFREMLAGDDSVDLVRSCGLICEAAGFPHAVATVGDQFDNLSMTVGGTDLVSVVRSLRDDLGFDGDRLTYDDPANSMLHLVIERRKGLPIMLAVVATELCRRRGISAQIIGMPGHVLVSDGRDHAIYVDPFHSSRQMSSAEAQSLYESMTGLQNFVPSFLDPIPPQAVLWRILNNLLSRYRRDGDTAGLRWVMKLRGAFPESGPELDKEFARLMGPTN